MIAKAPLAIGFGVTMSDDRMELLLEAVKHGVKVHGLLRDPTEADV